MRDVLKVPLRKTFEAMEMTVEWRAPDTVIVSVGGQSVIFKIGSNVINCGENNYEAEETALLINDTTYISYDAVTLLAIMRK